MSSMWTGGSPGNAQSDDDGAIDWICCDGCNKWCHALCTGVCDIHESDDWLCLACSDSWVEC